MYKDFGNGITVQLDWIDGACIDIDWDNELVKDFILREDNPVGKSLRNARAAMGEINIIFEVCTQRDWWQGNRRAQSIDMERDTDNIRVVLGSQYATESEKSYAQRVLDDFERLQESKSVRKQRRSKFEAIRKVAFEALKERDGLICAACGTQEDITVDHIVPITAGGGDDWENLQLLCRGCNSRKGGSR